jgi:DNA-binding NarL/FixJ family response regulator
MHVLSIGVHNQWRLMGECLSAYLDDFDGLGVVLCTRPEDMVGLVQRRAVDVVLVDAVSATGMLRRLGKQVPALVMTSSPQPGVVASLLSAGAAGVFTREESPTLLPDAVRQVAAGSLRLPPGMAYPVLALMRDGAVLPEAQVRLNKLTPREQEILRLLAEGHRIAGISASLLLSPHTVRSHVGSLLRKLALHSQLEAAAWARRFLPWPEAG